MCRQSALPGVVGPIALAPTLCHEPVARRRHCSTCPLIHIQTVHLLVVQLAVSQGRQARWSAKHRQGVTLMQPRYRRASWAGRQQDGCREHGYNERMEAQLARVPV